MSTFIVMLARDALLNQFGNEVMVPAQEMRVANCGALIFYESEERVTCIQAPGTWISARRLTTLEAEALERASQPQEPV